MPKEPRISQSRESRSNANRAPNSRSHAGTTRQATSEAPNSQSNRRQKQRPPRPRESEDSGADRWPLRHFPPPPEDGHWMPKSGGNLVNKIPPKLTGLPPSPSATFHPPLISLTYPPPPPLCDDPAWLPQMVKDVQRQRGHVEMQLELAQAEAASALVEATLAHAELEKETGLMQTFLNRVAYIAGSGFLRRLLSDVDDILAFRLHPDDEQDSDGSHDEEEEEVEAAVTENESGQNADGQEEEETEEADETEEAEEYLEALEEKGEEQERSRSPSPGVETNAFAVGRRRGRPLRRDPYRLREDHLGEPILYTVVE